MTDKARIKIAAIVTALFLAGISTAGVAMHKPAPAGVTTPAVVVQHRAADSAAQPPAVAEHDGYDAESGEEAD